MILVNLPSVVAAYIETGRGEKTLRAHLAAA